MADGFAAAGEEMMEGKGGGGLSSPASLSLSLSVLDGPDPNSSPYDTASLPVWPSPTSSLFREFYFLKKLFLFIFEKHTIISKFSKTNLPLL
jgi:hypothetical protein